MINWAANILPLAIARYVTQFAAPGARLKLLKDLLSRLFLITACKSVPLLDKLRVAV